jgi:excisionase family DNA binding protein
MERTANTPTECEQVLEQISSAPPFITPNGVGKLLGVDGGTVIAMARRGDIRYVHFGDGGRIRIPRSEVIRLVTPAEALPA